MALYGCILQFNVQGIKNTIDKRARVFRTISLTEINRLVQALPWGNIITIQQLINRHPEDTAIPLSTCVKWTSVQSNC